MARPIRGLELDAEQRRELKTWVRAATTPQRSVQRALIILACADGLSQAEAARQVGVRRRIVTKWCGRFRQQGLAGLTDARGHGRKPSLPADRRAIILTQATRPPRAKPGTVCVRWPGRPTSPSAPCMPCGRPMTSSRT